MRAQQSRAAFTELDLFQINMFSTGVVLEWNKAVAGEPCAATDPAAAAAAADALISDYSHAH